MNARWWLVLERAQAALPVLGAAALAGFTWWLVQSSPREGGASGAKPAASAPDYELHRARIVRVDPQGRLEAVLDGDRIRHFPATERLLVDELTLAARDAKGQSLHAQAREGEADQRAEVVTLRGQVRAQAVSYPEPGSGLRRDVGPANFSGEGLRIDTRARVVSSNTVVKMEQDHSVVRAQGLRYDQNSGVAQLQGRVVGQYDAPTR